MAKNIEMNYKQGESEYEVLYPNVKVESVIDIEEHYYTKNEINGQISDIIPNPYGVLAVKATDDEGNPVSVQLTVNPKINNSSTITTDSGSGLFVVFVNPGTYNLTAPAGSDFIEYNIDVPSAQVKTNQVTNVNVGVNVVQSGELEITSSRTIQFPASFNIPVDIWGCGGGGSGSNVPEPGISSGDRIMASGGASGGYTLFLQNQLVSGQTVTLTSGNGGASVKASIDDGSEFAESGNKGGNTSVKIGNNATQTAKGGSGAGLDDGTGVAQGGGNGKAGGSGGGAAISKELRGDTFTAAGNGGSNGANGQGAEVNIWTASGGKGSGIDTHIFQDPSRDLCCGGAGGLAYDDDSTSHYKMGNPGSGAGANFFQYDSWDKGSFSAGNAITYGSAGGSIMLGRGLARSDTATSGSGKQGVVFIRWPSQST